MRNDSGKEALNKIILSEFFQWMHSWKFQYIKAMQIAYLSLSELELNLFYQKKNFVLFFFIVEC